MILSRTLEYSSQLPVSVYGTGTYALNANTTFLGSPVISSVRPKPPLNAHFRPDVETLALRHGSACIRSRGLLTSSPSKPGLRLLLRPRLTLR